MTDHPGRNEVEWNTFLLLNQYHQFIKLKPVKDTAQQQPLPGQIPQGYFIPMPTPVAEPEDEISLVDLWRVLVDYKRIIAIIVLTSLILSVVITLQITPVYRAEVLLAPAANDSGNKGGIAALTNQFGGLAGLAGISVGGGGDIETAIATLKSRKFITGFITDFGLKQILFKDQWDNKNGQWMVNAPSTITKMLRKVKSTILPTPESNLPPNLAPGEPSPGTAFKKFSGGILTVSQDKKTQLLTVSVEWENPVEAAEWANTLVKRLNEELRQKTIDEAERSIAYLTKQISQTSLSELQNVLYRIIEEHTKVITLAKVNDEYVLKVIDPAVPPEIRSKPDRKMIVIMGLFLGVVLGVILAFILNAVRNWRIKGEVTSHGPHKCETGTAESAKE